VKVLKRDNFEYLVNAVAGGVAEVVEIKTGKAGVLLLSPGELSTLKALQEPKASVIPSLKTLERRPQGWLTRLRKRRELLPQDSRKKASKE